MPTAHVNDVDLAYDLIGTGDRTVVLVNGLADDRATWAYQVPDLVAAGYRVLTFDNRGIGASSKPAGPYSSEMLAADTKALVDALGISAFHLMGVSMGGMVAQVYALTHPGDLLSATFACTYAAPGPFCSRMFALWADLSPVMGVPFVMREVTLWAFSLGFFDTRAGELAEFESAMAYLDQPVHAYLAQLAVIQGHDTTDRLGELTVPTLVLAGAEDILIPTELSRRLHALVPGARWNTTPGGHGCIWEHPDPFNQTFLGFLADVDSAR